jgi:sterol desaturase/sphingolipid hydroxylase (fatty acid hydroxylase superfamily)
MILKGAIFIAGLLSWTLLEYAIHGVMAHLLKTFVTPIHLEHHRDPHAVFAIGSWIPSILALAALYHLFGFAPGVVFYAGLFCGFCIYEILHYRFHFAPNLTPWERHLRAHHLVHHLRRPKMCLGVTTSFWDRVFGTEPSPEESAVLCASVKNVAPLSGPSNLHSLISAVLSFGRSPTP